MYIHLLLLNCNNVHTYVNFCPIFIPSSKSFTISSSPSIVEPSDKSDWCREIKGLSYEKNLRASCRFTFYVHSHMLCERFVITNAIKLAVSLGRPFWQSRVRAIIWYLKLVKLVAYVSLSVFASFKLLFLLFQTICFKLLKLL